MKRGKTRASTESAGSPETAAGPALPAWKAFVVQFSREAGVEPGVFSGRVEHLRSGRRTSFHSQDEFLAVCARLLADVVSEEAAPPADDER